jgi:hypothetical protein
MLGDHGRDLLASELPYAVAQRLLLVAEPEVDHGCASL